MRFNKNIARKTTAFLLSACAVSSTIVPVQAEEYDMDCKVILCIVAGFPGDCKDAYRYMIRRITRFPNPLPPFGVCTGTSEDYTDVASSYAYLSPRTRQGYVCPEGKNLSFRTIEEDDGPDRVEAFCYGSRHTTTTGNGDNAETRTVYSDRSGAIHVNFQIQVTVEPDTPEAYSSPNYRLNYNTGFVTPSVGFDPVGVGQ